MIKATHFALLVLAPVDALIRELYTTNAACRQQYCVNPVYPGLQDLPSLEKKRWAKISLPKIAKTIDFCNGTINYNVALPMNSTEDVNVSMLQELVRKQDQRAAQTYFLHMSAMGLEPWDHVKPFEDSSSQMRSCARAVARMACFTYLPDAIHNVQDGAEVRRLIRGIVVPVIPAVKTSSRLVAWSAVTKAPCVCGLHLSQRPFRSFRWPIPMVSWGMAIAVQSRRTVAIGKRLSSYPQNPGIPRTLKVMM